MFVLRLRKEGISRYVRRIHKYTYHVLKAVLIQTEPGAVILSSHRIPWIQSHRLLILVMVLKTNYNPLYKSQISTDAPVTGGHTSDLTNPSRLTSTPYWNSTHVHSHHAASWVDLLRHFTVLKSAGRKTVDHKQIQSRLFYFLIEILAQKFWYWNYFYS